MCLPSSSICFEQSSDSPTVSARPSLANPADIAAMPLHQPASDGAEFSALPTTVISQRRKRPLRTYSRRTLPTSVQRQEPSRVGRYGAVNSDQARTDPVTKLPAPCGREQAERRPTRTSILTYFKPLPRTSGDASDTASPSDKTSSDCAEPASKPPLSPPPPPKPRKRRRLTTRAQLGGGDPLRNGGAGDDALADTAATDDPPDEHARRPTIDESTVRVGDERPCTMRSALGEVAVNVLRHESGRGSAAANPSTRNKRRPGKRPAKDMTQTTLSLSVHKEPGFTICGVCDILYNPLNEKDRREHSRRHAAYSRQRGRAA